MYCMSCGTEIVSGAAFCAKCGTSTAPGAAFLARPDVASSGKRFLNYVVDYVTFSVVLVAIGVAYTSSTGESLGFWTSMGIIMLYYVVFEGVWQQTLGKMLTGTKVVRVDGTKPKWPQIIGRTLGRLIPFDAISYLALKNGWHDRVSGTYVVPAKMAVEEIEQIDKTRLSGQRSIAVVIAIVFGGIFLIGLLSTLAVVAINSARGTSRDAARLRDIEEVRQNLDAYHVRHDAYPVGENVALGDDDFMMLCESGFLWDCEFEDEESFGDMPVGPAITSPACGALGQYYRYTAKDDSYEVTFCLEKGLNGHAAGKHVLTPEGVK